jgi:hypothetical protein
MATKVPHESIPKRVTQENMNNPPKTTVPDPIRKQGLPSSLAKDIHDGPNVSPASGSRKKTPY